MAVPRKGIPDKRHGAAQMGKNKLKKFKEMESMTMVFQYPFNTLKQEGFPLRGRWRGGFFRNPGPIVLELGCGKGEYTVGMARMFPEKNFIGVDIKGARMWSGASKARDEGIANVAFIRTNIELLPGFFASDEVEEIWITFPDPQMKKERKRLTSPRFLELYRRVLLPGGRVHLKTDSPFLYNYTKLVVEYNHLSVLACEEDLYRDGDPSGVLGIKTFYEQQWLSRGMTIKYLAFLPGGDTPLATPEEVDIEFDTYRSFPRGVLQGNCPQSTKSK